MAHGGDTASSDAYAFDEPSFASSTPTVDRSPLREHLREWAPVYWAAALSRLLVLAVGFGAELVMRRTGADPAHWRPFAHAETYPHYVDVATNGYTLDNAVNHPVMPTLLAAGRALGVPFAATGMIVSTIAFVAGLVLFAMLGERYVGRAAAVRAATYLALAPFAYWFSVTSTESLMLLFVAGSALLAVRATPASWLAAGALGSLAVLTRPPGALVGLLLLAIAIAQLRERRLDRRGILAAVAAGLMLPVTLLGFFAYLRARTGDPLASIHAQDGFHRHVSLGGPADAFTSALRAVAAGSLGQAVELAATFGAAALLVWFAASAAGRRWEIRGWTAFGAASLVLPLMTGVLWQMPRFALLVPPVFWVLGTIGGRHRWLHAAAVTVCVSGLVVTVAASVVGVEG